MLHAFAVPHDHPLRHLRARDTYGDALGGDAELYRAFGLNRRQLELIAFATPKRSYYCLLKRTVYGSGPPGPLSREEMLDILKDDRRIDLCIGRGTNRRKAIDEGGRLKGFPSGRCVVGYTDADQGPDAGTGTGRVLDTLVVAAAEAYYTLAGTLRATDQRAAEREWFYDWRGVIQHMQGSLLVP